MSAHSNIRAVVVQVDKFKLRKEGCEWWAAEVDVLPYGLVLDFVLSDSALQAWDNNGQQVRCLYPSYHHLLMSIPGSSMMGFFWECSVQQHPASLE